MIGVSQAVSPNSLAKQEKIVHDRPPMLAIGVMIWLGTELMFFSGLFAALFTIRAHLASWPPVGTHLDVLQSGIFTLILIALVLHDAVRRVAHRASAPRRGPQLDHRHDDHGHARSSPTRPTSGRTSRRAGTRTPTARSSSSPPACTVCTCSSASWPWPSSSFACAVARATPVSCHLPGRELLLALRRRRLDRAVLGPVPAEVGDGVTSPFSTLRWPLGSSVSRARPGRALRRRRAGVDKTTPYQTTRKNAGTPNSTIVKKNATASSSSTATSTITYNAPSSALGHARRRALHAELRVVPRHRRPTASRPTARPAPTRTSSASDRRRSTSGSTRVACRPRKTRRPSRPSVASPRSRPTRRSRSPRGSTRSRRAIPTSRTPHLKNANVADGAALFALNCAAVSHHRGRRRRPRDEHVRAVAAPHPRVPGRRGDSHRTGQHAALHRQPE